MMVRRMVVTIVCDTDATLRDLKERGFWDHCATTQLRIQDIEAHELPKRAPLAAQPQPVGVPT
jgi:hypothetical protein